MAHQSEYHPGILKMKFIFSLNAPPARLQSEVLMSTMAEVRTPSARRSSVVRVLFWLLAAVLLLLAGAAGYGFYLAHSALPQLDGRIQIVGLSGPVTVTRDARGVTTVDAASLEDL